MVSSDPLLTQVIGNYQIEERLGRGGMATVYRARQLNMHRDVAIKIMSAELASDPQFVARFEREAKVIASLEHPRIVPVHDFGHEGDLFYLVMRLIEGETLYDRMLAGPLPPQTAAKLIAQIAEALDYAHERGVVHRDLKPNNILLDDYDNVYMMDFGLAKLVAATSNLTETGMVLGTPAYMAPEQLLGNTVDGRADIYAFGVLLAEMVTGRHPLAADDKPPHPFADIVARCMQPDPPARYASARELLAVLETARSSPANDSAPADTGSHRSNEQRSSASGTEMDSDSAQRHSANAADSAVRVNRATAGSARWWWEFHQAAAALVYWVTMIPAWQARQALGAPWGRAFFILALVAVIVAATLRLNLLFTSRFYPAELRWARRRAGRWIRAADWVFAITLAVGGLAIGDDTSPVSILLLSIAIGSVVAFLVIERVTTRAAFRTTGTPTT